jgi:tetratricopeptide (TPR) repeat protein
MGQHKVSEKLARQALSLYRDQADTAGILKALWLIQMCYHRRGESVPAERIGREALRIARDHDLLDNPTLPNIQHLLAWNKISQAKYAEAEGFARRALKGHLRVHGSEHPETAFCRRVVARALREQGQYSEAEQHARNALTIFRKHFPDDNREVLKSVRQLIGLLSVQGKWEAMANLDKNYPDSAALYFVRAQTYAKRRRLYGEAIKDYQRAIELDPKNRQLKQLSGDLYARRGCWQEAVNHYQSTTTADGINALYTYACLLILTNRENQYRSLCMQMIDQPLNTRNVMALRRRVQIGALHPASPIDPDRLVEWAEKAISIRRNRFTISALAWAKYRSARFEETIALLKEGIDNQNIHKSSVAFLLALTFHQLGDHQKSRTWYRFGCRVLELASPQTPEDVAAWALQHWLFVNVWYREARAELESTTPLTAPKPRFDRPLVAPRTTAQSR